LGDGTGAIEGGSRKFEFVRGQYRNRVTGIPGAAAGTGGDGYAATYLFPNETAGLQTEELTLNADRLLTFDHYEATYGFLGRVCFDTVQNCPFKSNPLAANSDRSWQRVAVLVPKATKKIIIAGVNSGKNQGAVGLDNIKLLIPGPNNDENGAKELCPNQRLRFN